MMMRNNIVEEQIQWMLSYVQGGLADVWKKDIIKDLKSENLSYMIVGKFLTDLEQEFGRKNDKTMK